MIPKVLMLLGNYDPGTHRGIARAARDLNWHLNVTMLSSFQIPSQWKGDGIICSLNNNPKLESFIKQSLLPCVDLSAWRTDLDLPRISIDNQAIGALATEHFTTYGHQSFGWFCHNQSPISKIRYQSFRDQLIKRGYPPPHKLEGSHTQNEKEVKEWLLTLPTPTAVFTYNDNDAAWLMQVCLSSGLQVPEDIALLGVDNNPLICEHLPVTLSSINHDHERIGYEGALLLNQIILGDEPPKKILNIQPHGITLRASSDNHAHKDELVRTALNFLQKHLNRPIGTPEVANELGVSRRNLELRFRTATNTSIHKKLVKLRLNKAKKLLLETNNKIEDIAISCGFCHSPHLCRAFKKEHGKSPLAYRKQQLRSQGTGIT